MTHVMDLPDTLAEIDRFRATIADHFITFDPGDVDEKRLLLDAAEALERNESEGAQRPCTAARWCLMPARSSASPAISTARSTRAISSSSTSPT